MTIELAFLAYLITQRSSFPKLQFIKGASIEWPLFFYILIALLLFIAILFCAIAIITRLYDLRITRHLVFARKICLKKFNKYLPENYLELENIKAFHSFKKAITGKIKFIHFKENTAYESILTDFQDLRKHAKKLGDFTWYAHNIQIVLLLVATLLYARLII